MGTVALTIAGAATGYAGLAITSNLGGARVDGGVVGSHVANIGLHDAVGTGTFDVGDPVTVTDGGTTIFKGTIKSVQETAMDPAESGYLSVPISAVANTFLSEVKVTGHYMSTVAGDIFKDLNTRYHLGIDTTAVVDGPTIEDVTFDDFPSVQEAFDRIRERTTGYFWSISAGSALTFDRTGQATAALHNLTDSPSAKSYDSLRVIRTQGTTYNQVVIIGSDGEQPEITENKTFDKGVQYWGLKHRIGTGGTAKVVDTVSAATYDLSERGFSDDSVGDFVFGKGTDREALRVGTIADAGTRTMAFSYKPVHRLYYGMQDLDNLKGSGVRHYSLSAADTTTLSDAIQRARGFLDEQGTGSITKITYTTWDDPGDIGSLQTITLASRNVSGTFFITQVTRQIVATDIWRYSVQVVSELPRRSETSRVRNAVQPQAGNEVKSDQDQMFEAREMRLLHDDVRATQTYTMTEV